MLSMLQETFSQTSSDKSRSFSEEDFDQSTFRRNYADYLLGEVKDQLAFYYGDDEYESFLKFFEFLDGKNKFTYEEYLEAYSNHEKYLKQVKGQMPRFMSTAPDFLQFLYDLNVICFIERTEDGKPHIHWCFRDRTYSNISPKVKLGETYEIFYGMSKALNTGKRLSRKKA
jgi:uncharacterized protein YnzC (UPF0291/DUF896 family)